MFSLQCTSIYFGGCKPDNFQSTTPILLNITFKGLEKVDSSELVALVQPILKHQKRYVL